MQVADVNRQGALAPNSPPPLARQLGPSLITCTPTMANKVVGSREDFVGWLQPQHHRSSCGIESASPQHATWTPPASKSHHAIIVCACSSSSPSHAIHLSPAAVPARGKRSRGQAGGLCAHLQRQAPQVLHRVGAAGQQVSAPLVPFLVIQ